MSFLRAGSRTCTAMWIHMASSLVCMVGQIALRPLASCEAWHDQQGKGLPHMQSAVGLGVCRQIMLGNVVGITAAECYRYQGSSCGSLLHIEDHAVRACPGIYSAEHIAVLSTTQYLLHEDVSYGMSKAAFLVMGSGKSGTRDPHL